jgi:hypothetical protein
MTDLMVKMLPRLKKHISKDEFLYFELLKALRVFLRRSSPGL